MIYVGCTSACKCDNCMYNNDLDWTTAETYKHIIDESESIMVMPVMLRFSFSKMGTWEKVLWSISNSIDPKSQFTILSRTLEQILFSNLIHYNQLHIILQNVQYWLKSAQIYIQLKVEQLPTTSTRNHQVSLFLFFQVAWYVEPHLKSCSTNVFVSSLWYGTGLLLKVMWVFKSWSRPFAGS